MRLLAVVVLYHPVDREYQQLSAAGGQIAVVG